MKTRERDTLLAALNRRFAQHPQRHKGMAWPAVAARIEARAAALASLGEFDTKTSSWIATPSTVRSLGGALFCDRRYGQVFLCHNGVQ
jgi:Protein of unknown function (DUF4256)